MESSRLRSIIERIAWEAENEADVMAILTSLRHDVQWEPHLQRAAHRRAEAEEANRAFSARLVPCERCGKEVTLLEAATHSVAYKRYCVQCSEIVSELYKRQCMYCGATYSVGGIKDYPGLCKACWREDWAKEARRLYLQIERTKNLDLLAQLSLKNWLTTLEHFSWSCAYCRGEFEAMDHYVPLSRGGPTTWNNVLPSCQRCNRKKAGALPCDERMRGRFPADTFERIEAYFSSLTTSTG